SVGRQRWAELLRRVDSKAALEQLVAMSRDKERKVRQTAVRALLYADPAKLPADEALVPALLAEMRAGSPAAQRVALATAGRIAAQREKLAEAIVQSGSTTPSDRLHEHAFTYALISSGNRQAVSQGILSADEPTRLAAALALDVLRRPRTAVSTERWLEIPAAGLGKPLVEADRAELLAREASLPGGDAARGKALFTSERVACAKCHRVGQEGGQVGPDLTTIGRSRAARDLLESLLYPSASYARGFAPYTVVTKDGKALSGIVLGESATRIRLGIDAQNAHWVTHDNIEEIRAAELSIMPDDVAKRLEPQQLADLLAYLRSLK
ncbi:MAG TPA: c-type cytochrome, partial [Pirellulaceae bacterium]|nr:c-type cytochrome [Pirellulaceae bacterium]